MCQALNDDVRGFSSSHTRKGKTRGSMKIIDRDWQDLDTYNGMFRYDVCVCTHEGRSRPPFLARDRVPLTHRGVRQRTRR